MPVRTLARCSAFGLWPQHKLIQSEPFAVTVAEGSAPIQIRIGLQTYKNRLSYAQPAEISLSADKYCYPTFEKTTGFYVGETLFVEKVGDAAGKVAMIPPYEGDIDIFAQVEEDPEGIVVRGALVPYVSTYMMTLMLNSGDIITPKLPFTTFSFGATERSFGIQIHSGGTFPRHRVPFCDLKTGMQKFQTFSEATDREEILCIGAAARRITAGKTELDPIDKFCDYWEACEFLCAKPEYANTKDKSMRVAQELAKVLDEHHSDLWEVLIKPIYEFRNNIVHEFVYRENEARPFIDLLEDVAYKLFAARTGARTDNSSSVVNYLEEVRSGKRGPMHREGRPTTYKLRPKPAR